MSQIESGGTPGRLDVPGERIRFRLPPSTTRVDRQVTGLTVTPGKAQPSPFSGLVAAISEGANAIKTHTEIDLVIGEKLKGLGREAINPQIDSWLAEIQLNPESNPLGPDPSKWEGQLDEYLETKLGDFQNQYGVLDDKSLEGAREYARQELSSRLKPYTVTKTLNQWKQSVDSSLLQVKELYALGDKEAADALAESTFKFYGQKLGISDLAWKQAVTSVANEGITSNQIRQVLDKLSAVQAAGEVGVILNGLDSMRQIASDPTASPEARRAALVALASSEGQAVSLLSAQTVKASTDAKRATSLDQFLSLQGEIAGIEKNIKLLPPGSAENMQRLLSATSDINMAALEKVVEQEAASYYLAAHDAGYTPEALTENASKLEALRKKLTDAGVDNPNLAAGLAGRSKAILDQVEKALKGDKKAQIATGASAITSSVRELIGSVPAEERGTPQMKDEMTRRFVNYGFDKQATAQAIVDSLNDDQMRPTVVDWLKTSLNNPEFKDTLLRATQINGFEKLPPGIRNPLSLWAALPDVFRSTAGGVPLLQEMLDNPEVFNDQYITEPAGGEAAFTNRFDDYQYELGQNRSAGPLFQEWTKRANFLNPFGGRSPYTLTPNAQTQMRGMYRAVEAFAKNSPSIPPEAKDDFIRLTMDGIAQNFLTEQKGQLRFIPAIGNLAYGHPSTQEDWDDYTRGTLALMHAQGNISETDYKKYLANVSAFTLPDDATIRRLAAEGKFRIQYRSADISKTPLVFEVSMNLPDNFQGDLAKSLPEFSYIVGDTNKKDSWYKAMMGLGKIIRQDTFERAYAVNNTRRNLATGIYLPGFGAPDLPEVPVLGPPTLSDILSRNELRKRDWTEIQKRSHSDGQYIAEFLKNLATPDFAK